MKNGNWVPLSKKLVRRLPKDREYSEVEAMFSISVDYDCSNPASISGYSSLWGWSRKRVSNFLEKHDLTIHYQDKFNRHKKGQVGYQEGSRTGTGKEQVEFIDSKCLRNEGNRRGTGGEQEGNRKGSTTIYPNPNPNPNPKNKGFDPLSIRPDWFPEKDFVDVVSHRKKHPKKPASTERAYKALVNQFEKAVQAGFTVSECVDRMTQRSWAGFEAEWMKSDIKQTPKRGGYVEPTAAKNYRDGI